MTQTLKSQVDLFFQDPHNYFEDQRHHSSLYLLRRDIFTCFGVNPNDDSPLQSQALFPATMAIMAGIDLLSKFLYLDDESGSTRTRQRFIDFLGKYFDCEHSEALYQLRNSLLHSFGLYSRDKRTKQEFNFILDQNNTDLVKQLDSMNHIVSIRLLWQRFEGTSKNSRLLAGNRMLNPEV